MTTEKAVDLDPKKMDKNDEFQETFVDLPALMAPLLSKFKMEICAEVTARVAYSVKLMLDKHFDEVRALILQQGDKWEEMMKDVTRKELDMKEEKKRQKEERKAGKKQRKQDTARVPGNPESSRTTWTFLRQDGTIKTSGVEDHNTLVKKEEKKWKKEVKNKLKKERKHKLEEHTPEHAFLTEDPAPRRFMGEEERQGQQPKQTAEDAATAIESLETPLACVNDSVSEPVACTEPVITNEEKQASLMDPDLETQHPSLDHTKEANPASLTNPDLQTQHPSLDHTKEANPASLMNPDLQTQHPSLDHTEQANPSQSGRSAEEDRSVEDSILPSFVVCDEPQEVKARQRSTSSSSGSGSEFEVVPVPAAVTNSQHSYSSAETCLLPTDSDEDTDLDGFVNVRKKQLDEFDSLPGFWEGIAGTRKEKYVPVQQEPNENEVETPSKDVVSEEPQSAGCEAGINVGENDDRSSGQCGEIDEASGEASEDIPQDSASPRTSREKVFTEDLFQQVDAFEKKTLTQKTAKDTVIFVPPVQEAEILSPARVQQVPVEPASFPSVPQSSRGGALEEALLNIPYENSHAMEQDQETIPEDPILPHRYSVDVPAETLWEGALTRAAQAYYTARTAVDDLSDTFSHVRQRSRRIPRRGMGSETLRKQQCLMQLEEMGFHNHQLNVRLLEQHNYDLEIVITALVELQNGW